MCSLDPNGLGGCPRFAFGIRFGFVQTTDETGASEPISSTFLTRRCFKGLNTDTRTKASFCARDALAEGLPMTEFLRARRDLTLIGESMAIGMRGEGKEASRLIPITNSDGYRFASPQPENDEGNISKNCEEVGCVHKVVDQNTWIVAWKFDSLRSLSLLPWPSICKHSSGCGTIRERFIPEPLEQDGRDGGNPSNDGTPITTCGYGTLRLSVSNHDV